MVGNAHPTRILMKSNNNEFQIQEQISGGKKMDRENNVFYWLPCSVVFVCTTHGETRDIMTATAMFVSEKEPLLAISVAQGHLTEKLIHQSGNFTLVIAGNEHKQLAMQVGSVKGDAGDKFEKFKIQTEKTIGASIPTGSAAWMECHVESSHEIKGYRIFIGRVVNQEDLKRPPLVWHKDGFFGLRPI
jgi:flavin reductase (DIM6/NTAB) family NADH-FMN oxidoreductase RutF